MTSENIEIKAPQDVIFDVPQEVITGDILRGRGPRRGNLERLLRYWRPIMRKPGGFRRCLAILANHPELYPLQRICAWLHHETTGLWPNEGCHHPGMKNCRSKLRQWTDADFTRFINTGKRVDRIIGKPKKKSGEFSDDLFFYDFEPIGNDEPISVVTEADYKHAFSVLADFVEMEGDFAKYLRSPLNWEIEGSNEKGELITADFEEKSIESECCPGADTKQIL